MTTTPEETAKHLANLESAVALFKDEERDSLLDSMRYFTRLASELAATKAELKEAAREIRRNARERERVESELAAAKAELERERELKSWFADHLEAAALATGALDVKGGGYDPERVAKRGAIHREMARRTEAAESRLGEVEKALEWLLEKPGNWDEVFMHGDNNGSGESILRVLIAAWKEGK